MAQWNHAHADVQVEALALPYDGFASKLEAAIPRGNGPDLVIFGARAPSATGRAPGSSSRSQDMLPANEFLDGTVEPLRAGRQAVGRCRSPSRAWRCSIARDLVAAAAGDHRRAGGAGAADQGGERARALRARLRSGRVVLSRALAARLRRAPPRRRTAGPRSTATAPWRRWRSSSSSPPRSCCRRSRPASSPRSCSTTGARRSPSTARGSSARSRPACPSAWRRCRR